MSMYVNKMEVKGETVTVLTINHKEENGLSVSQVHHILLLDRSHSMRGDIDELMENVKTAISSIKDGDLISVIWFASADQCQAIIRGAKKDDDLNKIIDTLKSTVGTTCFSVPLAEALSVVNDFEVLCPHYSVTLFTDGHPVTSWSVEEEQNRINEVLKVLAPKVIAVNTIGYGSYYNQQILHDISSASQYGVFNHSSRISDYSALFGHNYERINDLNIGNIEVTADGMQILYLGDKNSMLYTDKLALRMLSKRRNQVFIIGEDDSDFEFEYNGAIYNTADIKAQRLLPTTIRNLHYSMAYNLYYQGKREEALNVLLKDLGDKGLVDSHMAAFTFEEVENQSNALRKAIFKTKYRYVGGLCTEDYLPRKDAICVMDVLRVLSTSDSYYVAPVGKGKRYKRIGKKVIDVFGSTSKVEKEVSSKMSDNMIMNEEKMNVSFRVRRPINVHINPKSAARVGLPEIVEAKEYRSYAVIKDGILNQGEIEVLMPEGTYEELLAAQVPMTYIKDEHMVGEGTSAFVKRVVVKLSSLPVINRMYTETNIEEVYESVKRVTEAKVAQKVLNSYLKNLAQKDNVAFVKEGAFIPLSKEQIEVLQDHGIDNKYEYKPIQTKTEACGDTYETRTLDFDMKSFASLPKVEDVLAKMGKSASMTPSQAAMANYIEELEEKARAVNLNLSEMDAKKFLQEELKQVKAALLQERMFLSVVKMGRVLTGGWFENLEPDGKGSYIYPRVEYTLVVKPKRQVVAI